MKFKESILLVSLASLVSFSSCKKQDEQSEGASMKVEAPAQTKVVSTEVKMASAPWINKPTNEWPQIVLTNDAEFEGDRWLSGASSFLVENSKGDVFLASVDHLLGPAGGVSPRISQSVFDEQLISWVSYPRTKPENAINILNVAGAGEQRPNSDWLLLRIKPGQKLNAAPLKLSTKKVKQGDKVYLIGVPYSDADSAQNVYEGVVTRVDRFTFRYDLKPHVELPGFSGAPIVNSEGHMVGVMSVNFRPKMSGDFYKEGGAQNVRSIHFILEKSKP